MNFVHQIPESKVGLLIFLATLTACGGGTSGNDEVSFLKLTDTVSAQSSPLSAVAMDIDGRRTSRTEGTLDRGESIFQLGELAGIFDEDLSLIQLDNGGAIEVDLSGNVYSGRFVSSPKDGTVLVGIFGDDTPVEGLPDGRAIYSGTTNVTIQDGTKLFDLSGQSVVTFDFNQRSVETLLSDLDGVLSEGFSSQTDVADVAEVAVVNSVVSQNGFSGGEIAISSSSLSPLGESPTVSTEGAFFGPSGEEVGGVIFLDDTASGSIRLFADFIGRQ